MPHRDGEYAALFDMLGFAREVVSFVDGRHRHELDTDRVLLRALERSFELIGEVPEEFQKVPAMRIPEFPGRGWLACGTHNDAV